MLSDIAYKLKPNKMKETKRWSFFSQFQFLNFRILRNK